MTWLYEDGIGENRAVRVEDDAIVEAVIELPGDARLGDVLSGRLTAILIPGRRGLVSSEKGEIFVEPLPAQLTQGQAVHVEIVREAIGEPGRPKRAKGRITDAAERAGPSLLERIRGAQVLKSFGPDRLEAAGWSELLEEARGGEIAFAGGGLRMSVTPAMTLFDVDGTLAPDVLAVAGAAAAARTIRRMGVTGSIGIDLPTLGPRDQRLRAAEAVDALLPQPFERTAVNGFGFLQIVRRRERPSLPELLRDDPVGAAARALLRRAEREPGAGALTLHAAPVVIDRLTAETSWVETLQRRIGGAIALSADPSLPIFGAYAHRL